MKCKNYSLLKKERNKLNARKHREYYKMCIYGKRYRYYELPI